MDKFFARCFKLGYCSKQYSIVDLLFDRDSKLSQRITSMETALYDLLPAQRSRHLRDRPHNFILPKECTNLFKSVFINRCSFNNY